MNDKDLKYLIRGKDVLSPNDYSGYKYCPRCRGDLEISEIEQTVRPHCRACGFVFYQNPAPAAGAVILRDNKVLMVQRSIDPGRGDWCIPAGFMEWNEHPQQTAVRELKEETGLEISITGMFDIFFGMDDPRTHAVLILYLADAVGGQAVAADDAMDLRFFGFDELPTNIAFRSHRDALELFQKRFPDRE